MFKSQLLCQLSYAPDMTPEWDQKSRLKNIASDWHSFERRRAARDTSKKPFQYISCRARH